MSLMQILQEVNALKREIDQQRNVLDSFVKSNRSQISFVRAELKGSSKGYDVSMLNALSQVESSLTKAQAALARATQALERVALV